MSIQFKQLEPTSSDTGRTNYLSLSGKLDKEDYALFVPILEENIEKHGKIDVLIELHDFHGWTAGAAWEDTKFGVRHFNDIRKLAIVGDRKWEKNMARFVKVFTRAKVRYFDQQETEQATEWVNARAQEVSHG